MLVVDQTYMVESHEHYFKRLMPLYIADACYKYNHRNTENVLNVFIRGGFA